MRQFIVSYDKRFVKGFDIFYLFFSILLLTIQSDCDTIIKHEKNALVAQWIECPATNR